MAYNKFNTSNNARGPILTGISASATSIILKTGYGATFPTSNFLITVEKLDTTVTPNIVTKREIIKVISRVGDALNVTGGRGYGTCTPSDSSQTPGNTAFTFDTDDIVSVYLPEEVISDIQDEVERLESVKANISDIQKGTYVYQSTSTGNDSYAISLTPSITSYITGQVFMFMADVGNTGPATINIDGLGAKTIKKLHDVDLSSGDIEPGQTVQVAYDGTNFQMNSQIAMVPTPDVNGLSEDTTPDMDNDFFLEYDVSSASNKKSKMSSLRSTDPEAKVGTLNTKFISAKQAKDNYYTIVVASEDILAQSVGEATPNTGIYSKYKEILINKSGTYRIKFTIRAASGNNAVSVSIFGKVYKNGVAIGVESSAVNQTSTGYTTTISSEDFTLDSGDLIQVYCYKTGTGNVGVLDFKVCGYLFGNIPTVNM